MKMKVYFLKLHPILYLFVILFMATTTVAQTSVKVTGQITSQDGAPAPGVSVLVKGTARGVSSDGQGHYTITVPNNAILVFTQIGSVKQEISVNKRTVINVVLKDDVSQLNEVVVVGYGTQKKVNLTGAVTQVSGEELTNRPVPNVTAALQGVAPGVAISRQTGRPGDEGYGIRIRGFSSANGSNALVLVDGMEMDMNLINPDDVESISVLKDASAAAIYGARAAGGVVLITTKKGAEGKTRINFNNYYGLNITARQPERLNSWDEQTLIDESRFNATGSREYTPEQIEWLKNTNFDIRENPTQDRWEYFGNNNWLKEGMDKVNSMQNYTLSVSGGSQKLNYLASGSYYSRNGVLRYGPDDNARTNIKLNINADLNKYLSVGFVGGYIGSTVNLNSNGTDNIIDRLYRSRTRQLLYVPAEDITGQIYNGDLQINAVDIEKNGGKETRNYDTFQGKLNLSIKNVIKGLTVDFAAWRNQNYYNQESDKRSLFWYGRTTNTVRFQFNVPNELGMTKNKGFQNNLQGTFTYNLQLNKHNFKLLGGTSFEEYRKDEFSAVGKGMITNDFYSFNFSDPLQKTVNDNVETWAFSSYFGRFNYNFDERYLFEASFRYDGSSRLAPQNRWKLFPSFSAGWRINEERFFKETFPFISNLKLRASWGQLGNGTGFGLYDYLGLISSGLVLNGNNAGSYPNLVFNDQRTQYLLQEELPSVDKTWEIVQNTDLGLDLGLLQERLTVTADVFIKRNKNMLARLNVPNIIGVGTSKTNVGELKSWGWELETKWRDRIGKFSYNIGFNITDAQNKLVRYNGTNSIGSGGQVDLLEGYPLNSIWGYRTDGYFQSQAEADEYRTKVKYPFFANYTAGDVKYLDLDGNGTIDAGDGTPQSSGDLVYLGSNNPRYLFGADFGFSWKRIDFSAMLQGTSERRFLIDRSTVAPFYETSNMPWTIHMDRWTPENPNALFPRMYQTSDHNYRPSDKWAQNGNYIRLKNIQLGYTIPVKKKYIQTLRVYFSGQDLWESTKVLKVFDPEVGTDASSNNLVRANTYPFYRTISFGMNVGL
ncbi:SusC/RagA family TonB-linked outer membrane protein [Arcticibacter tournemirensis]|nr:TonB-dependent receptor [Arcticibacter tournemirensis]